MRLISTQPQLHIEMNFFFLYVDIFPFVIESDKHKFQFSVWLAVLVQLSLFRTYYVYLYSQGLYMPEINVAKCFSCYERGTFSASYP